MYKPSEKRYDKMLYRRCGKSGILLPTLSLGFWHNFGDITPFGVQQSLLRTAFEGGVLSNKYFHGIPADSRAGYDPRYLKPENIKPKTLAVVRELNELASERNQSLPQMALAWTLRNPVVTSALIGASKPEQITENIKVFDNLHFTPEELAKIDSILL